MLVDLAVKAIAKRFKLDKVLDYVEKDNVLDRKVKKLEKKVHKLENDTLKFHTGGSIK